MKTSDLKTLFGTRIVLPVVLMAASSTLFAQAASSDQPVNDLPNPYKTVSDWAKLPDGWTWGATGGVSIDPAGNIWVLTRCGIDSCINATQDPIMEFDKSGKFLKSFGSGLFATPHSLTIDSEGHLWVADFQAKSGKGMQVWEFSLDGKVLMTLGKAGVAGDGPDEFSQPAAVAISRKGEIFVADGHGQPGSNARVVKFSKDGKFIKTWGKKGTGPGEFSALHTLAFDMNGRLLVGDRGNNRIQIFDEDGNYITEWKQFGRPGGIFVDKKNNIYVADSDSNSKSHPGWQRGIRIGSAADGTVKYFIPDPNTDPNFSNTSAAEFAAADADGHIYGAEVGPKDLKKYVKK
jgi:DNA-binding beta-propeller fold protein YncE